MTVTSIEKDTTTLTMTVTAEFAAPVEQVWQLWADPRKLERWWGPPTYPATVVDHDLTPGGTVSYFMTSPDGDKFHGYWTIVAVDAPRSLQVQDGFADDTGQANPDMPSTAMQLALHDTPAGTRAVITSTFASVEAMEQLLQMGMEEGLREAMGQMDALLPA